nr:MAG TPA: hypothetical protein [Inoviridae sp.]
MKRMAASFCLRPKWHVQTSKPWLYKTPHFNTPLCCTSFVQDMSEMRGLFVYGRAFSMDAAAAFTEGDAQISSDSARRHHCNAFHGGQRREFGLPLRQGCDPERHKKHCPHEQTVQHPLFSVQCRKNKPGGQHCERNRHGGERQKQMRRNIHLAANSCDQPKQDECRREAAHHSGQGMCRKARRTAFGTHFAFLHKTTPPCSYQKVCMEVSVHSGFIC